MSHPVVHMDRRSVIMGLAAGTVIPLSGCTGGSSGLFYSEADIITLSDQAWADALRRERQLRDPYYLSRVERVGRAMVPASGQTHLNWEFVVLDNDSVNAWVLPNGKVAFHKGLLDLMDEDGHVAAVMGHEMGHVAGRHAQARANQQRGADIGMQIATIALQSQGVDIDRNTAAILGAGVTYGVILPYSRQHEFEADQRGIDFMVASGYRASDAVDVWMALSTMHEQSNFEFMSTHPSDDARIAAMREHIAARGYA
ncbi:M48 family metallopeptidase [Hyphobacterium marinum]|uniref:M48 family metallopeptidase n=1 Tax=Hyphobacterium marinum TaxID=3116574 RepID=A0ABU7M1R0_9PROT|nr:M48 family metallopeptidase [Hyphobacterium sp. Y6023]MEE2567744.1 M48 family metallopeptidase [Hyphobacterium sp. Y6023]